MSVSATDHWPFVSQILGPLQSKLDHLLGSLSSALPLAEFVKMWNAQKTEMERVCKNACDDWGRCIGAGLRDFLTNRSDFEDMTSMDDMMTIGRSPPFELCRFPCFIDAIVKRFEGQLQHIQSRMVADINKVIEECFSHLSNGVGFRFKNLSSDGVVFLTEDSAEDLVGRILFLMAMWTESMFTTLSSLDQTADSVPDTEWLETCAAERAPLLRHLVELETARSTIRSLFGFRTGVPSWSITAAPLTRMPTKLAVDPFGNVLTGVYQPDTRVFGVGLCIHMVQNVEDGVTNAQQACIIPVSFGGFEIKHQPLAENCVPPSFIFAIDTSSAGDDSTSESYKLVAVDKADPLKLHIISVDLSPGGNHTATLVNICQLESRADDIEIDAAGLIYVLGVPCPMHSTGIVKVYERDPVNASGMHFSEMSLRCVRMLDLSSMPDMTHGNFAFQPGLAVSPDGTTVYTRAFGQNKTQILLFEGGVYKRSLKGFFASGPGQMQDIAIHETGTIMTLHGNGTMCWPSIFPLSRVKSDSPGRAEKIPKIETIGGGCFALDGEGNVVVVDSDRTLHVVPWKVSF